MSRRLAILSAPGSRGDVNPMVSIGKALRARGFDVAISLAEPYAEVASAAGLEPYPIIDREKFKKLLADPAVWKLLRGMRRVIRGVASDFLTPHFELIQKLHRPGKTVLVSHPLDFGSRIHRDLDPSTPLVDVHLAPVMLRTPDAPAHLTPWTIEPTRMRWSFRFAYLIGDLAVLDPLLCPPVNRIRKLHGLPPVRRIMDRWWLSPDRVLAMYPSWYAPGTVGALEQLRHVGFPLDDACPQSTTPAGELPHGGIAFTGGTANHHTRPFFERAAESCVALDVPGILLGSEPDCFPGSLPDSVVASGYVPLTELLPKCRAIVHHGGIGTTSQALRAGIPQLIRPMAFDQFDNAARVTELGVGRTLRRDRKLTRMLSALLDDRRIGETASSLAGKFQSVPGAERAADEIEALQPA